MQDFSIRNRLEKLNIALPQLAGPFGAYLPAMIVGNHVYVSGQLPMKDGQLIASGPVPSRCPAETAKLAARQCVINALSSIKAVDEDAYERLAGVIRVGVFVNSDNDFTQQPAIANGASEFLVEIFGNAGKHVRAAVGVNTLPLGASVEVEFIFHLYPIEHVSN